MSDAPEYTLEIRRGDSRPVMMAFKSLVNDAPLGLTGSTFSLVLYDALGAIVLTKAGTIGFDEVVSFDLTLEEKAALTPGGNGRWEVTRSIDTTVEVWGSGASRITGVI